MKGTHQGHNWNKPLRWDGRSDYMDAKRVARTKKRKHPQRRIDAVYKRCNGECVVCGTAKDLEIHHILPISEGGTNKTENLELLCQKCHDMKHGRTRSTGSNPAEVKG